MISVVDEHQRRFQNDFLVIPHLMVQLRSKTELFPRFPQKLNSQSLGAFYTNALLNQQGGVLGFWAYRSGLGVVSMVPIDSPPSEGPGTTLVPWKTGRMVAGTMESMGTNGWQLGPPPLVPPN